MSDNKLRFLSYEDMCNLPEPEWLVEGLIQKRSTALMFGKSNSFKSFLAIDIGLSVDTGQDWHGNAAGAGSIVSSGGVLFVATEGANGVGRLRIPGWYDHHRIEDVYRRAFLYPKEIRLDVVDDVTCLIETMKSGWPFALVVLDIFGGTMAGSEVEDKTARAWVQGIQRILRETGASVLTVAHTGWQDDSRARMHTHFWGSFDTRLKVEGDKEAMTATLTVERHKDADSNGSWGFRMVQSCETLVPELDVTVKADRKRTLSAKNRAALNALDDALAEAGEKKVGADWPPCNVVRIDTWRQHFYRHSADDTTDAKKKAFQRARDALREHGQVQFYDDHAWRCHG
ncbi:AAA family ATPase [Mesorhizobium sp. M1A.T.Ca.IN.004.03.1.1]|uniref:AAA family ATPase n=1 Tax=Mesorhizobium sp. M1A.T.Ca.IN.004.03.1.1 TaxID=2496795 RepID=UPI000FCBA3D9|nr:AAA family ATPase [Mesorhizobium sp. M1A.T.Ca.IN.004.03.1.1]RUV41398.1 AAA family ATPase [Mesorhizobium sp. M1A.T.Ca.IN.004.03.1.1]